jgi:hypothetical protein
VTAPWATDGEVRRLAELATCDRRCDDQSVHGGGCIPKARALADKIAPVVADREKEAREDERRHLGDEARELHLDGAPPPRHWGFVSTWITLDDSAGAVYPYFRSLGMPVGDIKGALDTVAAYMQSGKGALDVVTAYIQSGSALADALAEVERLGEQLDDCNDELSHARAVKASAWDEGYEAAVHDIANRHTPTSNPYRADSREGGGDRR